MPTTGADCLNPLSELPVAERILVIRLGALGDVVRSLPAVAGLRALHPGARLCWLVEPPAAGVLRDRPEVDEVVVLPRDALEADLRAGRLLSLARRMRGVARVLRAGRYDLVLDLHGLLKSGVLAAITRAPLRVGLAPPHAREPAWLFYTHRVRLPPHPISRFRRNAALVAFLGGDGRPCAASRIEPAAAALARMRAALDAPGDVVLLHPGTSAGTPYKRWPPDRYAAVARALAGRAGLHCRVSSGGAPEERALADAVVAAARGAATRAPATPDLESLAALCSLASVFVGSDSGPLHLASAVGTPVVQLLGPTHPVENEPRPDVPWRRVHVPQPCSPCRRGCAAASCMAAIGPDAVVAALDELLAASAGPTAHAAGGGRHAGVRPDAGVGA